MPEGTDPATVKVDAGGRDVTSAFALRGDGCRLGLVDGLPLGDTVVTARAAGKPPVSLTITNHPIGGPVFAGPQIQPWTCFPGARDEQCNRDPLIS